MGKIRKTDNATFGENLGHQNLHILLVRIEGGTITLENTWQFLTILSICFLYDLAIPIICIVKRNERLCPQKYL